MRSRVSPGVALGLGLADADDGEEPGPPGGGGLAGDDRVGLAVVGPALGMADDDRDGAGVGQHLGRDVAGVGAGGAPSGSPGRRSGRGRRRAGRRASRAGRSARRSAARAARAASSSSIAAEAARPFIFQFPATSLRRAMGPAFGCEVSAPASRGCRSGKVGSARGSALPRPVAGGLGVVEGGVGERPVAHAGGDAVPAGVGELLGILRRRAPRRGAGRLEIDALLAGDDGEDPAVAVEREAAHHRAGADARQLLEELEHEGAGGGRDRHLSMPANLINSPQPQASVTLGLLNLKPDSISPVA